MSSLKCTGVNALLFPVHFNRSVLKLLNLGTTVKRKRVRCSDFQNMLLPGLSYTRHEKNIEIYKNVGVATKAPPFFNLAQNGHFLEHGWSDFYETFESGFFDFKQIHTVLSLINAPGALQFFKRGMSIRGKFSMQKCSV